MWGLWRKAERGTSEPVDSPVAMRVMDAKEIAIHVVEAMRVTRYWLTRDMENAARIWCDENNVEPIQPCHLRAAVQFAPGVKYAKLNLRGPKFGPIRKALQNRGMRTEQQYVYEIAPAQSCASPCPVLPQAWPVSIQSRTVRDRPSPATDQHKPRAA